VLGLYGAIMSMARQVLSMSLPNENLIHLKNPGDLFFSPGDIIEVLKEINEDWWEGLCNGRSGLFPSNHVEKTTSLRFPVSSTKAPPALTGEKVSSHIPTPNYQPQYLTFSPGYAYTPTPVPHPDQVPHVPNKASMIIDEQPMSSKRKRHFFHSGLRSIVCKFRPLSRSNVTFRLACSVCN